jgi:hypothetical protein
MLTVSKVAVRTRGSVETGAKAAPLQGGNRKSFEPLQLTSLASLLDEPFSPATLQTFGSKPQPRFSGQGKSLSTLSANPLHSPQQIFSRKDCFCGCGCADVENSGVAKL